MICPFLSTAEPIKDSKSYKPCIASCALYVDGSCAFAVLAKSHKSANKQTASSEKGTAV
jgi:hypothetical protein